MKKCIKCEVPVFDSGPHEMSLIELIKSGEAEEVGGMDEDGEALCVECAKEAK